MMGIRWGTKIAAMCTAAALMLGGAAGLPSAMAAEATTEMTAEELAATEKQYTDAVWEATNWLVVDFEPQQLHDLGEALEGLAKHLWETGTTSDPQILVNCITYAGTTLRATGENEDIDLAPETESAYNTTMLSLEKAKRARNDILDARRHQQNVDGIEAGTTHVITEEEQATLRPIGGSDADISLPTNAYTMDNFQKTVTYAGFTDVLSTDWFFGAVKTAVEYGLVKGTSDTTFSPQGNVTVQEAVVMAARLRCIYNWGKSSVQSPDTTPVGNADAWASAEINFAIQSGIIQSTDFADYKANITRAEMAYIFAHALPESTGVYAAVNTIEDNAIPDVKTTDKYGAEIYTLYRAGVLTGGDGNRCNPDKAISRAETAAIVSRLPIPSEHKTFTIEKPQEPVAGNKIPSEYMPIYAAIYLTETQYQVGTGMTLHMYDKNTGEEYPLVSKSEYTKTPAGFYASSIVFAAPLDFDKSFVKIKAEGDGLTGRFTTVASSWELGSVSDDVQLYMPLEREGAEDYSNGLRPEAPVIVTFSIDQEPAITLNFISADLDVPVGNLPVNILDGVSDTPIQKNTTESGRLYLDISPSGVWELNIASTGYTFMNGMTVRPVYTSPMNFGESLKIYVKSINTGS